MSSVTKTELANGLTVITENIPQAQSVGIGFFVKTGSRDEQPEESGVSHFLEHMLFKGTPNRTALDITYDMGNIGAQSNAFTSEENTVYYATVLPEYLDKAQAVLTDQMRPTLDEGEFNTEKKVILEEIALYQDRPQFYLFENANKDFFGDHPVGNSVLGTNASITALTQPQMKSYFDRRYSPNNMVFACAGKIDSEKVIRQVEQLCGSWERKHTPREYSPFVARTKKHCFKKANIQQAHVLVLMDGPSAQEEERYAAGLLAMMIGDSTGSRMYYDLVQSGIAEGAGADSDERDGTGSFYAYAVTTPEEVDKTSNIIKSILESPKNFSDADLQRAKTKAVSRMVGSGELPMGRLMALGMEWTYRNEIHSLKESIQKIKAVGMVDVHRLLERFPMSTRAEYHLLPEE